MEVRELEASIEATLAATWPMARDARDALVAYFNLVARPFVLRGLSHTQPQASEEEIRRLLVLRLGTLWRSVEARWDEPQVADLARFKERIEHYACVRPSDPSLQRVRRLLDDLLLAAAVNERLRGHRPKALRRFRVVPGGGERTEPRGKLALVRAALAERSGVQSAAPGAPEKG